MKVGSDRNYVVRVSERGWDVNPAKAPLYVGMYSFDLNHAVPISFVPRVTATGPPWSLDGVPGRTSEFTTPEHARLLEVLSQAYSVTPDDERAAIRFIDERIIPLLSPFDAGSIGLAL